MLPVAGAIAFPVDHLVAANGKMRRTWILCWIIDQSIDCRADYLGFPGKRW
jgi:hypothetical protein